MHTTHHSTYETLVLLYAAANHHRFLMHGLYSVGPFTPVEFYYQRGRIGLRRHQPDTARVLVATITTQF